VATGINQTYPVAPRPIRRLVQLELKSKGKCLPVSKITWAQVGRVTEPGRYMYRFGWLTISDGDVAIWEQFPNAAFTLIRTAETGEDSAADEFRLGTFELRTNSNYSESEK
jgi:hypothetical protein